MLSPSDFPHYTEVTVRFNEVDMLGVCNNAVYISYFENARLQYIKAAGLMPAGGLFSDGSNFFMVRNEINYSSHARYDDTLRVFTKIAYIKNSSYGFEHLVTNTATGKVIADGKGVVVRVNPATGKPEPLSGEFISKVTAFQKQVTILRENKV